MYKLLSPETVAALKKYNSEATTSWPRKEVFMSLTLLIMNHHTPHEEQPDSHQFENAPEHEIDRILDYINSQHHQEDDMNNALQAYNVTTSQCPDDTP